MTLQQEWITFAPNALIIRIPAFNHVVTKMEPFKMVNKNTKSSWGGGKYLSLN